VDSAPTIARLLPVLGVVMLSACADPAGLALGEWFRVEGTRVGLFDCAPNEDLPLDSSGTALCAGRTDTLATDSVLYGTLFLVTDAYQDTLAGNAGSEPGRHWNGEGELTITRCRATGCEPIFVGVALMEVSRRESHCVDTRDVRTGACDFPDGRAVYYWFDVVEPIFLPALSGAVSPSDDRPPITMSMVDPSPLRNRVFSRVTWTLRQR
jgi:hypothetical protein